MLPKEVRELRCRASKIFTNPVDAKKAWDMLTSERWVALGKTDVKKYNKIKEMLEEEIKDE